jgi:branched-chain amino acid aminotransferase
MTQQHPKFVWMDGKFVPFHKATVHVQTHALHYGSSVFEGMRAYPSPDGPKVLFLREHVRRLFASAKMFRMPLAFSEDEVARAILELVAKNEHEWCYIRPLIYRGDETLGINPGRVSVHMAIMTSFLSLYLGEGAENGVDAGVSSWRRGAPGASMPIGKIGGQYAISQMMSAEALAHGYAEAIVLNHDGYVSEGPGENLFVVKDGALYTPPMSGSVLLGITRTGVMQIARALGYEVREQNFPREFLYMADEAFFTGTAVEVVPIRSVDRIPVGDGKPGPITARIQKMFFDIVYSRAEDKWGWLTPCVRAARPVKAERNGHTNGNGKVHKVLVEK